MFRQVLIAILSASFLSTSLFAEDLSPKKAADIKQLMYMTGTVNFASQMGSDVAKLILQAVKQKDPKMTDQVVEVIQREVMYVISENIDKPGGLIDNFVPIYHKHYSHQEILDLIAFNESPLGKKSIALMPIMYQEGQVLGKKWGESITPELIQRVQLALQKEGVK